MNKGSGRCRLGMHAGLWALEWSREVAERAIPEAAHYGLQVIEVPVGAPDRVDVAHARALFDKYGIEPTASLCLPAGTAAAATPERATDALLKSLEAAHALGSPVLTGVTYTELNWHASALPSEAELANIAAALKPVARKARALGMQLGLEPCNRYETHLLNTAAQASALIDRIDEPNVFIHLDTFHMHVEERGLGAAVRTAGQRCRYLHLSESDRGLPGSGNLDWIDLFRGLAEIGFAGDLVGEVFAPATPADAATLAVWHDGASRVEVLEKGVPFMRSLASQFGLI